MKKIALCYQVLNNENRIHGDLKPSNIVYKKDKNKEQEFALIDFGTSQPCKTNEDIPFYSKNKAPEIAMTENYAPPERCWSQKFDVFSFGTIFYELLCGEGNYPDWKKILNNRRPK